MKINDYYHQVGDRCLILNWLIMTLDENLEPKIPLQRRWHLLNWSKLDGQDIQLIVRHFDLKNDTNLAATLAHPSTSQPQDKIEFSSRFRDDSPLIRFRNHFDYVSEDEYLYIHRNPPCPAINSSGMTLPHYMEDMAGQPLSSYELAKRVHGADVILLGDIESILSLGHTPIVDGHTWTICDSNLLAHFFSVVEQIKASNWVHSTSQYIKQGNNVVESNLPRLHEFRSILLLFRQMYESKPKTDDLLRRVASRYCVVVNNKFKNCWIEQEIKQFESILSEEPMGMSGHGVSGRDFLEAFGYGYRLFHANPRLDGVSKLEKLVENYSPAEVMFSIDYTLRNIFSHAQKIYVLVKYDFDQWIQDGLSKPTILDFRDIIGR